MMSSISSLTPSGTASARLGAGASAGDPMASAFAMLFALMPGVGDADGGDAQPKSEGDTAKDGKTSETDGKDVPSDAAALPVMPFAIPTLPLVPPEPDAKPVAASGASAAPITTLLATMPTLPDAAAASVGVTTPVASDPTKAPIAFDPLKATMPVPPAMTAPAAGDTDSGLPIMIRPDAPLAKTTLNTGTTVPIATQPPASLAMAAPAATRPDASVAAIPRETVPSVPTASVPGAAVTIPEQAVRNATAGIPLAIRAEAVPTAIPVDGARAAPIRQDTPLRFTATNASASFVAPLPIEAPAPILQAGQTASAIQLFGLSIRGEQGSDPRIDRRKDDAALSVDPATLARADSLSAAPVAATTGAEQAPLDMTQHHWPQGMIDRIDRMREDAATADTRIQLSPDALGGIAVNLRQEDGATHIHFTADQAQTASMLADAQPTLARLAEEKGMRLGQTAVDMGQSGMGGERQAPPRRPDPVIPTRPAFTAATDPSDAGDPAAASTRIA
ncbi:flagellar hook-length control protein FliK [Sphingomonas sanguinis]|uniref:Flagellar hook-length control protein FliK n=1 Tax=Sphingomonas sanguinis TaxID=33051 RepID=A0ABU5LUT3_9SPHN|nr:flagellar hook-length control protein FliK [Sphingomonas sanguinis]MDZ7283693.1 flagellar hook-length control protein FliK [Sphingomonas sanguinis]